MGGGESLRCDLMHSMGSNGIYVTKKAVLDALRQSYLTSPRRRPGPKFG